jgi:uncharacterized damage-inducible protein DinB
MSMIERYRTWYEHERDCNDKMLGMIESVPVERRGDAKFSKAVTLAAHLAACRDNWLDRMRADGANQVDWWPEEVVAETLRPTFARVETEWTDYLNSLNEKDLERDFEFPGSNGLRYRWNIEGQIVQLVGHAFYHRGQVALLVEELGGETVDTDYLFWAFPRDPRYGRIETGGD